MASRVNLGVFKDANCWAKSKKYSNIFLWVPTSRVGSCVCALATIATLCPGCWLRSGSVLATLCPPLSLRSGCVSDIMATLCPGCWLRSGSVLATLLLRSGCDISTFWLRSLVGIDGSEITRSGLAARHSFLGPLLASCSFAFANNSLRLGIAGTYGRKRPVQNLKSKRIKVGAGCGFFKVKDTPLLVDGRFDIGISPDDTSKHLLFIFRAIFDEILPSRRF